MSKQIFITGTNTEVGKTHIGLELLKSLSLKYNCIAYKPIETGCRSENNKLIPSDSQKYEKLIGDKVSLEKINPYRFIPPVSPYKAIKDAKKKIYIKNYCEKIKNLPKAEIILIEGAGGAFSPLATDGLNIDLMKALKSINILVIKDQLGCIGNTISHILAFERLKISLDILILNTINPNKMDNYDEIRKYTNIPLFHYNKKQKSVFLKKVFKKIASFL